MLAKCGLQRRQLLAREPLDGDHLLVLCLGRKHQTGADSLTIDQDRARPAHTVLACEMRSGLAKIVSDAVRERRARLDIGFHGVAVEIEFDLHKILLNSRFL